MVFLSGDELWEEIERRVGARRRGRVRAAVAYVTRKDLFRKGDELVLNLDKRSAASHATNPRAVLALMESGRGVDCHHARNLHAKVYLGPDWALVGSANFTVNSAALREAGVLVADAEELRDVRRWYEALRKRRLTRSRVKMLQAIYDAAPWGSSPGGARGGGGAGKSGSGGRGAESGSPQFFYCNTNRRNTALGAGGGYFDEEYMLRRRRAAAFGRSVSQVDGVSEGDVVFLYASDHGIVAVGRAAGASRSAAGQRRQRYVSLDPLAELNRALPLREINLGVGVSKQYTFPSTCKPITDCGDGLRILAAARSRIADPELRGYFRQYASEVRRGLGGG